MSMEIIHFHHVIPYYSNSSTVFSIDLHLEK